tara:strand:+ start:2700 stop:3287 length:588 start_codon:yes stop_codon:yes gene_type:complete
MIDKDNDFGLKKVNLKNYKIKKNNSSIIFLVFILLIATYFYSKKEIYFDDMSENKITIKEKPNNKFIDEKILNDDIKIIEDSSENSNDDEKIKNLEIRETFYTINKSSIENIKILEVDTLSGKYYIISGSFSNYNLSLKKAKSLLNEGFQPIIIKPKSNNMHRVAIDLYDDIELARLSLVSYKNKLNNKLWILKY